MMKNERFENTEQKPDVIAGRNPVSEAVRSNRPIDKILVAKGEKSGAIVGILAKARDKKIPVKEVDRTKLDYVSGGATHQGIVALATAVVCGMTAMGLFVCCPRILVGFFLDTDTPAALIAIEGFPLFASGFVFFIVNLIVIGYYQSLERVRAATTFALLRGFVLLVPAFLLLPRVAGISGIWLAMPLSELLTCAVIAVFYNLRRGFGLRFS